MIKSSAIYIFSNIINALLPFFLLPFLTRYLTEEDYGKLAIFYTTISLLGVFIGLGVHGAAFRKYYDEDKQNIAEFIGACFFILFASIIIIFSLLIIFKHQILFIIDIKFQYILLCFVICSFDFVILIRLNQWQARNEATKFASLQIIRTLINLTLSLLLVFLVNLGVDGRVWAIACASLIIGIFSLISLSLNHLLSMNNLNTKYIKEALAFGVPLIPHIIGAFFIYTFDRFYINSQLGSVALAQYMVCVQLAAGLAIVFEAINNAFKPWLYRCLSSRDHFLVKKAVSYTYLSVAILILLIPIGLIIGPQLVLLVAGPKYVLASKLINCMIIGQIFSGVYLLFANFIFYSKNVKFVSIVSIVCGCTNALLLILLIPYLGIKGATYAFAISMLLQAVFTWSAAMIIFPPVISNFKFLKKE